MYPDRPLLGIALMLGFCVLAPLGDAIAKILGAVLPLGLLLLVRFAVQAVLLTPLVMASGRSWRMRRRVWWLATLRAGLHMAGIGAMFTALRFLPLADAVAIAFVMPFIMLLLGWAVLGEEIGHRRILACAVGFAGTLMVIQPSFREVGLPAFLPLIVALVFALYMLVTRAIAKDIDPIALQAVNGWMACAALVPAMLWGHAAEIAMLSFVAPTGGEWALLLAIGTLGTLAHLLMTWSLRYAPSATLAPMQYLEIPIATFFGWLIFADLPDGLAAAGICVTIAAGLYIVLRERAMSRVVPEAP